MISLTVFWDSNMPNRKSVVQPGLGRFGVITVLFLCFAFTNSYIQRFLKNKKICQHNKRNVSSMIGKPVMDEN